MTLVRDLKSGKAHPRVKPEADPTPLRDVQLGLYQLAARKLAAAWGTPQKVAGAYAYASGRGDVEERAFRERRGRAREGDEGAGSPPRRTSSHARAFPPTRGRGRLRVLPVPAALRRRRRPRRAARGAGRGGGRAARAVPRAQARRGGRRMTQPEARSRPGGPRRRHPRARRERHRRRRRRDRQDDAPRRAARRARRARRTTARRSRSGASPPSPSRARRRAS